MTTSLDLSRKDAQAIVTQHDPNGLVVSDLKAVSNSGFSHTTSSKTYIADLCTSESASSTHSTYITLFAPIDMDAKYHPNALNVSAHLISLISQSNIIPISNPYVDASLSIISSPYLMTPVENITSTMMVSLADLRGMKVLTPQQTVLLDLQLGKFLGQLHSGIMNEWYGMPLVKDPVDPSYSWQETFTSLLETLLVAAEARGYVFPYSDIRAALSRAIAFFIFDDVEVPSLIWFTGSEEDIYLKLHPSPGIAAILPNLGHALWGDPLMESFFASAPSQAMMEGYKDGGGEKLVVFARQKTKRLWYTLFLALVVISERESGEKKEKWAIETVATVSEELKTAPCYG